MASKEILCNKTGNVRINVTMRRDRLTTVAVQKQKSITYSECGSTKFVIKYAKCMRRITLSSVAGMALTYFPTLSHKRQDVRKKVIEQKVCYVDPKGSATSSQRICGTFL